MVMTTAQALVRFLKQQYIEVDGVQTEFIKGVFTLFGHGNVLGLGQALQELGMLEVYQGKNEQGMAHAAMAFAKQKLRRQIIPCTTSVGPGAANMVAAAGTATANNIPLLLLPGDVYACRQPDPVLQQIEITNSLSVSTNDAFKAVTKYWDRINRPEQLMTAMINAMRVLTDIGDTGAVAICLPQDVEAESYDYPDYFFEKRVYRLERVAPTAAMIAEAVDAITAARKPIVICGGGVRYSGAGEQLAMFCERFNIPFGETQAGKSALPYDFPFNMGGIGVTGGLAANRVASQADLVIALGTRLTDFTTASKSLFKTDARVININYSRFQAAKLDGVSVTADVRTALEVLSDVLAAKGYKSAYTDEYKAAKDEWNTEIDRLFNISYTGKDFVAEAPGKLDLDEYAERLGSKLTQTGVLGKLQELLPEDGIVVGSSGSLPGCMQRIWLPKKPQTYHMEYGYSCMGYEICGAVGVKLAEPDKEVYAMVGDGSFLMLHSELITAIQMGLKIHIVLFDNIGFGCINNLQMSNGMDTYGTEFRYGNTAEGKLMHIDFAAVARGYGAAAYTVTDYSQLEDAVKDAKNTKLPVLFDIKVLPKTMTGGYEAWWNTGVASVSKKTEIQAAYKEKVEMFDKARKY